MAGRTRFDDQQRRGFHVGFMGRVLRLALLPPDLVEAVSNGRQRAELSLPVLLEGVPAI